VRTGTDRLRPDSGRQQVASGDKLDTFTAWSPGGRGEYLIVHPDLRGGASRPVYVTNRPEGPMNPST